MKVLAASLKNSLVRELALDGNELGAEGAGALAAALPETNLTKLNLFGNGIGPEGARAVAFALKTSSLTWLDLGSNGLRAVGQQHLLDNLRASGLTRMVLKMHNPEAEREIEEVLEVNKLQAPSFVLQMEVQKTPAGSHLTFRTLSGAKAAALQWYHLQPVQELPEALLSAMHSSGFQGPSPQDFRTMHLQIVHPCGWTVDVGPSAEPLEHQLAR